MVHPSLEPYAKTPYVRRISRVMKHVDRDLATCGSRDLDITLASDRDASVWGELFTFRLGYHANQWLTVAGKACAFPFIWTLPFRNGVPLPSILEIPLHSHVDYQATLDPWIVSRGRWFSQPLNRSRSLALQGLKLPAVAWTHVAGGLKHRIRHGGMILAPTEDCPTNRWVVISGYQGFMLQRPRAATHLRHAGRLDQLLRSWEPVASQRRAA
jgi:hypothetical protein